MSHSDVMEEDLEGSDCDEQMDDDLDDGEDGFDDADDLQSGVSEDGNKEIVTLDDDESREGSKSRSSLSSGVLDEKINELNSVVDSAEEDGDIMEINPSEDGGSENHGSKKSVSLENVDSNSKSDFSASEGDSRSSVNREKSNGENSFPPPRKTPNLNECTGKPASMFKMVNGTIDDSSKDAESDSDPESSSDAKSKSNDKKDESLSGKKIDSVEEVVRENGKQNGDEKHEDDDSAPGKDGNKTGEKGNDDTNTKPSLDSVKADPKETQPNEEPKDGKASDGSEKSKETEPPAQIETRRRSLRNAAKKVEIEVTELKSPPKGEKRKPGESPRSKEKKQAKSEPPKEPPKPVEPTTEPMSEEILEEAKFPPFLKETITLGCYVPIRDKNTSNIKLKEGESLLETPSITMPLLLKKPDLINKKVEAKPAAKEDQSKKNYYQIKPFFNSSVGEFLIGIGLSRVTEWYERDMVKIKQRQLKKEPKNEDLENSLQEHTTSYLRSRQANEPFTSELKKCEMCDFKTESEIVLQGHLLVPHMTARREFQCNFCTFVTRDHKVILFHMEALHQKKGILELPGQFFYDCPYCPFETNLKTRATSHTNKCMKYFLSARNQLPPGDWENPTITAKPITLADIKSYEMCVAAASAVARTNSQKAAQNRGMTKSLAQPQRIIRPAPSTFRTTAPQSSLSLYQQIVTASLKDAGHLGQKNRFPTPITKTLPGKPEITVAVPGGQLYQVVNNGQVVPIIGHGGNSQFLIQSQASSNAPQPVALFPNLAASGSGGAKNSISIIPQSAIAAAAKKLPSSTSLIPTHTLSPAALNKMQQTLPKLQGPYTTVQTASKSAYGNPMLANTTFVICEICDGYLKDLEQLRTHMLWIHKVKIHPKMLSSRPPLNCQKCQWRFFTDQGLERHLLGAHGLVTSNMQELANKNQDGGRCTVCGRVYVCKLVSHMNQVHKATLKPAHLSYKCTVCSATFNLYKLFENHVYMFHSGSVKRSATDEAGNVKKKLNSVEMTVVPAKKNDNSMKVTVTTTPIARGSLPPPMKLPAVEPLPSITITPTNAIPEKSNPAGRLKKNSVDAENGEKTVINVIKKPPPRYNDVVRCRDCDKLVRNISVHMKLRHTRRCKVKLCHILKCEKCLGSFDGMVVLHTADFEEENSDGEGIDNTLPVECV